MNPTGSAATFFQYGTTKSYGHGTAIAQAGNGTMAETVAAPPTALNSSTSYHYLLAVVTSGGTIFGTDRTFITTASEPPSVISSNFRLLAGRATVSRLGRLSLRVACQRGNALCTGQLVLTAKGRAIVIGRKRSSLLALTLARKQISIRPNATSSVSRRLHGAGRALLNSAHCRHLPALEQIASLQRSLTISRPK